jgi:hypothetical protein
MLAEERCGAVVEQSCGGLRPDAILVIRVVGGFEDSNAALPFSVTVPKLQIVAALLAGT